MLKAENLDMSPIITQRRAELLSLCLKYRVLRLEVFGSAVSSTDLREDSDLDLLVEFQLLPQGEYADAFFGLLEALESLFGRPIDLVVSTAITNPYFRESVDRTKALLYAA
jgi:predicted nucleotidyltransferase